MSGSKGRKKKGKLHDLSAVKELSDGEMQNKLKLYGEDPGPITETTRLMHERRLAKHLHGPTPPTKLFINLFIYFFFFIFFFYLFIYLIF